MKKILIIEDDLSIAQLQKDYLEINHFAVHIETDGKKGLHAALAEPFDLILLDIMLPSLDGFELCKEIRRHLQTPIMIVSAKREDIDKIRGLGLGANDYMIKPFSPNELVARVKAHIARYESLSEPPQQNPLIEIDQLKIDPLAHKVCVLNQEILLTSKEFKLLLFFAQHPNRVWTKEELFEKVWGLDVLETDVATVVVHIKRIREKLRQANYPTPVIETIWGSGYRLNH